MTMARTSYTPEFKTKLVLEVLQGEKELNEIASEHSINPNMLRNWKKEFLANASRAFDETRQAREARRKEDVLKKDNERMLKIIGQITLERDFLQDCFRITGTPLPKLPKD
jgi:transposase